MIPPIFVVIILGMKIADGRKVLGEEMTFWLVINYRLWKILTDLMRGTALCMKRRYPPPSSRGSSFTYSVPSLVNTFWKRQNSQFLEIWRALQNSLDWFWAIIKGLFRFRALYYAHSVEILWFFCHSYFTWNQFWRI